MRAYELMIIVDVDAEEKGVDQATDRVASFVTGLGGRIANEDRWGRRRFAYEINHKLEGIYTVLEFVTPGGDFAPLERTLRLADEVVRHKLIRLPEKEAARRGLFGEPTSATEESKPEPNQTDQLSREQTAPGQIGDKATQIGSTRPAPEQIAPDQFVSEQPSGQPPSESQPADEADWKAAPQADGQTTPVTSGEQNGNTSAPGQQESVEV